jgi:hypothetical protein
VRWRTSLSPATVHQQRRLLLGRLDRHEPHRRPLHRLADRFRIGRIVLVALDVCLDVLRRHQAHRVADRLQLPRPVVRRRARLQTDQTARQPSEERKHLAAPQPLAHNRRPARIDAVDLKNVLRQIQPNRRNLVHGWLPSMVRFTTILAPRRRTGAIHPIIQ